MSLFNSIIKLLNGYTKTEYNDLLKQKESLIDSNIKLSAELFELKKKSANEALEKINSIDIQFKIDELQALTNELIIKLAEAEKCKKEYEEKNSKSISQIENLTSIIAEQNKEIEELQANNTVLINKNTSIKTELDIKTEEVSIFETLAKTLAAKNKELDKKLNKQNKKTKTNK